MKKPTKEFADSTQTDIVHVESVYLAKEHVSFLNDLVTQLQKKNGYKATKSQIIRVLIEGAMRRDIDLAVVSNEDDLRRIMNTIDNSEATRIRKK